MIKWALVAWIFGVVMDAACFGGALALRVLLPVLVIGWHLREEIRELAKKQERPTITEEKAETAPEVKEEI